MDQNYNFHNFISIKVDGEGSLSDFINFQYQGFKQNNKTNKIDEIVVQINNVSNGEQILGKLGNTNFQRKGNKFIISNNGNKIELNGEKKISEQNKLIVEPKSSKSLFNLYLELLLRTKLIKKRIILIHASGVSKRDNGILFPAWQGTGKTASCLSFVKDGFDYLGEDKLWVSEDKKIYSYPRYVRLNKSNLHLFKDFLNTKEKIKYCTHNILEKIAVKSKLDKKSRIINKLINSGYLLPNRPRQIEEFYPNVNVPKKVNLSLIVILQSNLNVSDPSIDSQILSADKTINNINYYEWNNELLLHASAHDILFPKNASWVKELEELQKQELSILTNITKEIKCLRLNLPKKQMMIPDNLKTEILSKLGEFNEHRQKY